MKKLLSLFMLLAFAGITLAGTTQFKQDGPGTEARGDYLFSEIIACTNNSITVTNNIRSYPWRPVLLKHSGTITNLNVNHVHVWNVPEYATLLETNVPAGTVSTNLVVTNMARNTITTSIFTNSGAGLVVSPTFADDYILPGDELVITFTASPGTQNILIHGKR